MNPHYDRDTLIDYLHGALAPEADASLFAHLRSCADCNAVYDEEAALGEALRFAARTEELEFPSMIKARVWDAVRREKPSWIQLLRTGWAPRVAVPVAAVVILAGYLGLPPIIHDHQGAAGVDASYLRLAKVSQRCCALAMAGVGLCTALKAATASAVLPSANSDSPITICASSAFILAPPLVSARRAAATASS